MHIADLIGKAKQFANEHSTELLTGAGSVGVVSTAYLSGKASFKAAEILYSQDEDFADIPLIDKVKMVWAFYIPPTTTGALTIASIVMGNRLASQQIAALTIASSVSERALQEYKAKVVEKLGENKDVAVREAIAQDKVDQVPIGTREVILAGTGEVLCFDIYSGRYFQSSVEEIKKAENKLNYSIINFGYASLSEFYDEIGLPHTGVSDDVGWNLGNSLVVSISTTMSSDGRPCVAVDFGTFPQPNYSRFN